MCVRKTSPAESWETLYFDISLEESVPFPEPGLPNCMDDHDIEGHSLAKSCIDMMKEMRKDNLPLAFARRERRPG